MRTFGLWHFSDGQISIITRGISEEQAMSYAAESPAFKRGVTIFPVNYLPIEAAELYNKNHAAGWLHRAPEWLQRQERTRAIEQGFQTVLENLFDNVNEILMFNGTRSNAATGC